MKERIHSCYKQRKKEGQGSPEVIVNIGVEDLHATLTIESSTHGSIDINPKQQTGKQ